VGLNLLSGVASGVRVRLPSGAEVVVAEQAQGPVMVAFPPTAVAVHRQRPEGSPRNVFQGRIVGFEPHGERVRLDVDGAVPVLADVTADAFSALELARGVPVWISVKAVEAVVYPT
jgi:molybdate transport system ATP-binding protein